MSMRLVNGVGVRVAVMALAAVVAGCSGPATPPQGEAPPATAEPAPEPITGPVGSVVGKITYEGQAARPRVIRMSSDPLCMTEGEALSEVLLVGPGNGLQNAFVYVKDGLGNRRFPVPTTPVVINQQGCRYRPHVIGIQVGQPLELRNGDPTLHNVHAIPKINREFNFGQPLKGMTSSRSFEQAEVMVPFKCDVHGWMNAYAGVLTHPFFAVSAADGSFEIEGLPPGSYTLEVWHEQLGTQTMDVTVSGDASATANFVMKAKA
jgi:plastocyanin